MRRLSLIAVMVFTFIGAPSIAQAFDIPLLTWERGREQQVVLGGGAYTQNWQVTMEGNGAEPLTFVASEKNDAGYVVYSVTIPKDFPTGAYEIVTRGEGSPRTVVAGIQLIPAIANTVTDNIRDLTLIIAIFAALTAIVSTIRARKYQYIPFQSQQMVAREGDDGLIPSDNFWDRLEAAPYRIRVQFITSLRPSLTRFLLLREGEVAHRLSRPFYGLSPLIGLVAGALAGVEVLRNEGVVSTPLSIFIGVSALAIFDAVAGLTATLGFWAVLLFTGNVTSFRDVLIALAVGIAWVGPSLFAALLRETINRDFHSKPIAGQDPVKILGVLGSSLVGGVVFYFGHALVNSVLYVEAIARTLTWVHIAIIAVLLLVRGFADAVVVGDKHSDNERDESFFIARTNSPITSLFVTAVIFAFVYIWTESAVRAITVAVIFGLPYVLSFIRFNPIKSLKITNLPRFILIESLVVAAAVFIVVRQVSLKPLLIDQKAGLILIVAGLSPVLHALYSVIYSSNEEKFSFEENQEIIKP